MSENSDIQTNEDAEFEVEDSQPDTPRGSRSGIALLALLLATIALGASAYLAWSAWQASDNTDDEAYQAGQEALDRRLDQQNEALTALDSRVSQITHPDFGPQIDAVRGEFGDRLRDLGSLPARMNALESSVASLAGISAGARETFLLAEAEYYLQIANAQLQLANNPHLATLALSMADERVTQISDPGLTAVRGAISDELAALELMEKPDLEGATLTLASLARVVESLPLASMTSETTDIEEFDAEQGNVSRAWASVKDAMSGLVRVTPPDQAKLAIVSPDAEYFLKSNISLQLQAARLALLRGEQAIFEQTLDDAGALLETYFDTQSEQVSSALQTIAEIRASVFTAPAPDISGSLRLLRQFRTLNEGTE